MISEAAGQNWQGPVSAQHEPIPEVVAALQIIMAEQQKILSSCAQFVSKPSINREDLRAGAETPEQSQNIRGKTQRNGRDIPMIDNFSLRGRGNAAAGRKETDQQPSNAPLNNQVGFLPHEEVCIKYRENFSRNSSPLQTFLPVFFLREFHEKYFTGAN